MKWQKIAKEMDWEPKRDQDLVRALQLVTSESERLSEVDIPDGYEERLVLALRQKLPQQQVVASSSLWTRVASWLHIPELPLQQWMAAGTFAAIAIVVGISVNGPSVEKPRSIGESMLLTTAGNADSESVNSWLDTVSDSARSAANRNLASLAQELQGLEASEQENVINNFVGSVHEI